MVSKDSTEQSTVSQSYAEYQESPGELLTSRIGSGIDILAAEITWGRTEQAHLREPSSSVEQ